MCIGLYITIYIYISRVSDRHSRNITNNNCWDLKLSYLVLYVFQVLPTPKMSAWYLDLSLVLAAMVWQSSGYKTSTSLVAFIIFYMMGRTMAAETAMEEMLDTAA